MVHLAGIPTEAPWADILDVNVTGSQTVLHAAAEAGVRTVVVASSNHAAGFWERPTDGSLLPDDVAPGRTRSTAGARRRSRASAGCTTSGTA